MKSMTRFQQQKHSWFVPHHFYLSSAPKPSKNFTQNYWFSCSWCLSDATSRYLWKLSKLGIACKNSPSQYWSSAVYTRWRVPIDHHSLLSLPSWGPLHGVMQARKETRRVAVFLISINFPTHGSLRNHCFCQEEPRWWTRKQCLCQVSDLVVIFFLFRFEKFSLSKKPPSPWNISWKMKKKSRSWFSCSVQRHCQNVWKLWWWHTKFANAAELFVLVLQASR